VATASTSQIRQLERSGKHVEAIALCTSYDPGQSNWAFEQFKFVVALPELKKAHISATCEPQKQHG
jgi:hypothetical protein